MGLLKINRADLYEHPVKTTPENVKEANEGLYRATMNLPAAAKHCGMTQKEMKLTFWEYLKYHKPDYEISKGHPLDIQAESPVLVKRWDHIFQTYATMMSSVNHFLEVVP